RAAVGRELQVRVAGERQRCRVRGHAARGARDQYAELVAAVRAGLRERAGAGDAAAERGLVAPAHTAIGRALPLVGETGARRSYAKSRRRVRRQTKRDVL